MTGDTIVARATPPGRAPRALVRVSGPHAPALARALLEPCPAEHPAARAVRLRLGPRTLPVLALAAPAPRTFTGEAILEILLPGNPVLVDRVIDALCAHPGVRRAQPGEFTARAYLAGRIALDQAEAVAATIAAETGADLDAARDLRQGHAGTRRAALADDLATCLALVEAGVDFTDQEDVVPIAPAALAARLDALAHALDAEGAAPRAAPDEHPRVVLVGVTGAGKSTLFNALLGRPRALTAKSPHTTRDALAEPIDLSPWAPGAGTVLLVDTAGLEHDAAPAHTPAQRAAIAATRAAIASADLLVHCDPAGRFEPSFAAPTLRVRTKADLPALDASAGDGAAGSPVAVCALDGFNLPALRRAIAEHARAERLGAHAALLPRHALALAHARDALRDARATIDPARPALPAPELTAEHLRDALDHLGSITGRLAPDDILARVFSTFCVGK